MKKSTKTEAKVPSEINYAPNCRYSVRLKMANGDLMYVSMWSDGHEVWHGDKKSSVPHVLNTSIAPSMMTRAEAHRVAHEIGCDKKFRHEAMVVKHR